MNEVITAGVVLAAILGGLLALAPRVSESLVRSTARRLPRPLSARMREEWLAELGALPGRASQLAFAIALTLTRRHSFAIEEGSLFAAPARTSITAATFGGSRASGAVIGWGGEASTFLTGTSRVRIWARLAGVHILGGFAASGTQRSSPGPPIGRASCRERV